METLEQGVTASERHLGAVFSHGVMVMDSETVSLHHVIISWPFYLLQFPLYKKTDVSEQV